jgi:hypothetical protein
MSLWEYLAKPWKRLAELRNRPWTPLLDRPKFRERYLKWEFWVFAAIVAFGPVWAQTH